MPALNECWIIAWKNLSQGSFNDAMIGYHKALQELDDVDALIDWLAIESLLSDIHNKTQAAQARPPLVMFKVLLLQSRYGLGDPALEKQLAPDLLFRRGEVSTIDAGVIGAQQNRLGKGRDRNETQDREAGYNAKQSSDGRRKTTCCCKAHLNVEEDGFRQYSRLTGIRIPAQW